MQEPVFGEQMLPLLGSPSDDDTSLPSASRFALSVEQAHGSLSGIHATPTLGLMVVNG